MKKVTIILISMIILITIFAFANKSGVSYAATDNATTVNVVVASPDDITANLGVITPNNANVNLKVNSGTSDVNVNGVGPYHVNIEGINVAAASSDLAESVAMSVRGSQTNIDDFRNWVGPLWNKVGQNTADLSVNKQNLELTMNGLAKSITVLQDQSEQLKTQQSLLSQTADRLNASISAQEKLKASLNEQFGHIDSQFQTSIDRDKTLLTNLNGVRDNLGQQIQDNESRIDSVVSNYETMGNNINGMILSNANQYEEINTRINILILGVSIIAIGLLISIIVLTLKLRK